MESDASTSDAVPRTHFVILVHGIRTQAEYQQHVVHLLEADPEIRVIPLRYEFLDVISFLLWFREKPIARITTRIRDSLTMTPSPEKLSIVAHSFGTYIISKIITRNSDLKFHKIIFCGSIVPDSFAWEQYNTRYETPIINDCGMRDFLPILAKFVTWGYGSSGRFGFGHNRVVDRHHNLGHSGFFKADFPTQYWLSYLKNEEILEGELNRKVTPWWLSVLTILKLPVLLSIGAFWFFASSGYMSLIFGSYIEPVSIREPEMAASSECGAALAPAENRLVQLEADVEAIRIMLVSVDSETNEKNLKNLESRFSVELASAKETLENCSIY